MEGNTWSTKLYNVNKMNILDVFSLLGTISIFLAAILVSSKKIIKPKIRIWAFSFYIGACIFLGTWGLLMNSFDGNVQVIQQIFLFFINLRGIYHAVKEIKLYKVVDELKYGYDIKNRH